MTDIVLVRHARTAWSGRRYGGLSDPPLDRAGRTAAVRVAADLRAWLPPGTRIVSSPRRRAIETATAVASALGAAPIEVDDRWAETDFGVAEGLSYDELADAAPDIAARLVAGEVDIDWPAGERAAALAERVADAWQDVVRASDATTVVVTHGGPIRVAVAFATGRASAGVRLPEPAGTVRLARAGRDDVWRVIGRP